MLEKLRFEVTAGRRQLFLDDEGVDKIENLCRSMHQPAKKGAVVRGDPERGDSTVQTRSAPAWDPDARVFKLCVNVSGPAYVESADGLHWTKPILRQKEVNGSLENNYITVDPALKWPANAILNVVYDPDDPDPSRRFKGLGHCDGREPLVSPDCIHWRRLDVPKIPSQDNSSLSYDRLAHRFIASVKLSGPHGRAVYVSTSSDFQRWTEPELSFHADDLDQMLARRNIAGRFADPTRKDPEYNLPEHYSVDVYIMGMFRYEGLYVGMPAMFHHTGTVPKDWPGFAKMRLSSEVQALVSQHGDYTGFHHVQLACSRDLKHWERLGDRQPFIDASPMGAGAYDEQHMLSPAAPVARGDELWFYYTGTRGYAFISSDKPDMGAVCLAVLRRDGFVSLDAGFEEGSVLTQPFVAPQGDLHLNVDAFKGRAVVQVCDESGEAIPGFEASQGVEGDHLDVTVGWPSGQMAALAGQRIRLRIALRQAQFYAYWIN